ncbi:hypothetical protein [Paenibacillus ginsengarvi]|uniref:hypothetical protein n=1 Tax=Paenibacillus ginsengarvi TaxID=400777 RepID=UPI001EFFBB24|nr:hypothetical protein [Paenibacillus ginsengarvi]
MKTKLKSVRKMVALMDCIAAIPCIAGRRVSAAITKVENAKKMPAINPEPSAETKVRPKIHLSINVHPL